MKPTTTLIAISLSITMSVANAGQNSGDIEFHAISELTYDVNAKPTLIGARAAKPSNFPANFYSLSADGSCTSTMVASEVLFTAAHCVGNGKDVVINSNGRSYTGKCTHAAEYSSNSTADYALCKMSQAVPLPFYEKVNLDKTLIKVGQELLLTGFGCTQRGGGGGNDGVYRIGEAKVQVVPAGQNNDIVTLGSVALCFGDSGGPAYLLLDGTKDGSRLQVSINSRGNIFDTSYLSSLSTGTAINFIKSWALNNGVGICGVHADAANCRK